MNGRTGFHQSVTKYGNLVVKILKLLHSVTASEMLTGAEFTGLCTVRVGISAMFWLVRVCNEQQRKMTGRMNKK